MKTNKFYKLACQDLKNNDLKRILNKKDESSDFDSESELDTNTQQNIRRSEPQEKPACKKRAGGKYFGIRKPHIDPKTGGWLWGSTYKHQDHKAKFSKGPYRSDIDSS